MASGKTVVAVRWREAGVRVIDADRLGHDVLREDEAVRKALVDAFGDGILGPDVAVDRAVLGRRAFATDEGLQRLNAIVHPPLLERLRAELIRAEAEGEPIAVVDAALVFEFGLDRELDLTVLVTAPEEIRAERLRRSRGLDDATIERVMAAQLPDAEKAAASDYVIVNDGSLEALRAAADRVLAGIRSRPARGAVDEPASKEKDDAQP